jgi:hypothetical protein
MPLHVLWASSGVVSNKVADMHQDVWSWRYGMQKSKDEARGKNAWGGAVVCLGEVGVCKLCMRFGMRRLDRLSLVRNPRTRITLRYDLAFTDCSCTRRYCTVRHVDSKDTLTAQSHWLSII